MKIKTKKTKDGLLLVACRETRKDTTAYEAAEELGARPAGAHNEIEAHHAWVADEAERLCRRTFHIPARNPRKLAACKDRLMPQSP